MIRKISAAILALGMLFLLSACGQSNAMIMVGLALTGEDEGARTGESIQTSLEEAGHAVELAYAGTAQEQVEQIGDLVKDGAAVLAIHPVDSQEVEQYLSSGKCDVSNVTVIAVGAPVEAECVKAYVGPDLFDAGRQQANAVLQELALEEAEPGTTYTVELVAGNGAERAFAGAMEVLQPYVDAGTLVLPNSSSVEKCRTQDAGGRIQELCKGFYARRELNAVLCLGEGQAEQVIEALKSSYTGAAWPVVTGYGCDEVTVGYLASRMLSMVTYPEEMELESLAGKAIEAASAAQTNPEDNLIPCTAVTRGNYKKLLVKTGLYTAQEGGTFVKN